MIEEKAIPLSQPSIEINDIEAVARVLKTGMLVQGKEVQLLEKKIADYIGTNHAICVSSGTATLHLSLIASGIGPGDEVIVPSFSYIATANVAELVGAKPVFVDIDLRTFNIDVNKIESVITPKTKAIIPVHEFGLAAEISQVVSIAKKYNLSVIEDAACALGAKENNKYVGSFGDFGSFSFHPRKAITSGEGGILTTNDELRAHKIRVLRNHGIEYINGKMDFVEAGFNYRMTDFQAALVSSQFDRLNPIIEHKQQLAEVYLNEVNHPMVTLPIIPNNRNHTWQTFHILLESEAERNKMMSYLKEIGIMTNYGAQCIPHMTYYLNKYGHNSQSEFPNAFKAYTCGLAIPLYHPLTKEQIKYISKSINNFT